MRLDKDNQVPVEWAAKKQAQTADSPAAAEITAIRDAVAAGRQFVWRARDAGMQIEEPACIHTDSKQGISFAEATCLCSKMGGVFDRKEAWVRELRDAGKVKLMKIPTAENPADLMTKPFTGGKFQKMVKWILGGGPVRET